MVLEGWSPQVAAAACGTSRATAYRLLRRYREGGWEAFWDRPPIAKRCPHRLSEEAEAQIVGLRRQAGWGPRAIASALGRSPSTVWRVLRRYGLSRAERQPRPPANRYEYAAAGELVHLDTKKLGRFWQIGKRVLGDGVQRNRRAGWQHAHVAVDDHSRWGLVELRAREDAESCTAFLAAVISAYTEQGITIRRVMTDNGSGYRSRHFRALRRAHDIHHIRTQPYTPRTNGKAEAFIRILQREWAYAFAYPSSSHRARALPGWVRWYNHHRPHGALGGRPPISRISLAARSYT